jgi:hypothetical protein
MGSTLDVNERVIVFVLLAKCDNETAVVPPEYTPSFSTLEAATSLSRSMLSKYLDRLELLGWVKRAKPAKESRYERTRYALAIGASPERVKRPSRRWKDASGSSQEPQPSSSSQEPLITGEGAQDVGADAVASSSSQEPPVVLPKNRSRDSSSSSQELASTKDLSTKNTTTSSSENFETEQTEPPSRPEVLMLCRHLADAMVANGYRKPAITKKWLDAARLLLDRDGRTVEQVIKAIDWAHNNDFWKANIKSMQKLRAQYDTLRLRAQAEAKAKRAAEEPRQHREIPASTAPVRIDRNEMCPDHRGQRKHSCALCRAAKIGKAS